MAFHKASFGIAIDPAIKAARKAIEEAEAKKREAEYISQFIAINPVQYESLPADKKQEYMPALTYTTEGPMITHYEKVEKKEVPDVQTQFIPESPSVTPTSELYSEPGAMPEIAPVTTSPVMASVGLPKIHSYWYGVFGFGIIWLFSKLR